MDASKGGSLDLISGPMLSGKTSELLRRLLIDVELGFKVGYINHSIDTRSSGDFSTHNPLYKASLSVSGLEFIKADSLQNITEQIKGFDVIGIDEAQFFSDLKEVVPRWIDSYNKKVIVAGLTGDFEGKKFGQILDLEPMADTFTKLNSFCQPCAKQRKIKNAIFTHRIQRESKDQIQVGGAETYIPVCRKCYLQLTS